MLYTLLPDTCGSPREKSVPVSPISATSMAISCPSCAGARTRPDDCSAAARSAWYSSWMSTYSCSRGAGLARSPLPCLAPGSEPSLRLAPASGSSLILIRQMLTRPGHSCARSLRSWCSSAMGTLSPSIESTSSLGKSSVYRTNLTSASPIVAMCSSGAHSVADS